MFNKKLYAGRCVVENAKKHFQTMLSRIACQKQLAPYIPFQQHPLLCNFA